MKIMPPLAIAGALTFVACAPVDQSIRATVDRAEVCVASVFDEGSRLADGSRWSPGRSRTEVLVAHRRLPLGARVRITRLDTGAAIIAPVRDRGPYVAGRCVDLSVAAAAALGFSGLARVRVEPID
jgi:rare lipoprotein A